MLLLTGTAMALSSSGRHTFLLLIRYKPNNILSRVVTTFSGEIKFFPGSFIPFPGRDVTLPGSYIKSSGVTFPPSGEGHHPSGRLYEPFRAVFSLSGMACFPSRGVLLPFWAGVATIFPARRRWLRRQAEKL
ncbi:hypothetical protein FNH22_16150 [Fulvivirga sp. M361]|uniref:hypothetical protein n=1 Tax=Fulvivirga sp. M361 TaxID=2594266 RepID=UPI00117A66A6|nr:hypothetical protein [Fulvivirga sp. M361]TRX56172.1 hypothetical protein FNH22_16150 [Fulvivirga sp. M361]